ncbi:2,6-dihydropseudooxynicotine hydrolase [Annulohypoxylon maeteangense]|uniref:2,6-dihydropseudooxynicotine hydrolase n=1 Tax=Annulohypoxylon maeteangense TaxID=1927788 RepID=UPI0020087588|nr:2,6-dihydropseudooxynicotine hydrolase [Annulohypoxylon maeteangense]KAI0881992.1 2,6-dihydropseudooxynicotine hydrolase [Annulohypoxylon maeteangense]
MKFLNAPLLFLSCSSVALGSSFTRSRGFHSTKRDNSTNAGSMLQLSSDADFHFEILRALALAPYQGSDIGEVLVAANQISAGDFESYSTAFNDLADRVHDSANAIDTKSYPVSARNAFFREATYYRSADFYLHGNWNDSRIYSLWDKQLSAFDSAVALLPTPGERITLQGKGFKIPAIFFGSGLPGPRPTLLMCNGFDGSQEEMYHVIGEAVLQRGMNVITFEGPGQPTVRRYQGLGFIPEWEDVVTPIVDYASSRPEVDAKKIGLWGLSFGGYLAPRAAAFEHRLAAVVAFDGIYSFAQGISDQFGPQLAAIYETGNETLFNNVISQVLTNSSFPTSARWAIQQGLWSFNTKSAFQWYKQVQQYTLDGVIQNITAPVFVGDAQADMFFPGQAKMLAEKLGDRATYYLFNSIDGAGEHCSLGAAVLSAQVVLDWFQGIVS